MSLAGIIFDIYDDNNYSILRQDGEKIASCSCEASDKIQKLPDNAFAVIIKTASGEKLRKYPRHTPDAIKISAFYLNKVKDTLPESIKVAAIDGLVNEKTNTVTLEKEKVVYASTNNFGLKVGENSYFPLDTEEQVKTAVATFHLSCDKLLPSERYELAQNIIKQASLMDIGLNNNIYKYSNRTITKLAWLQGVKARIMNCLDNEKIAALKAYDPKDTNKALAFLAEFDKNAGLTNKVPDIYTSVFADIIKIAGLKIASKEEKIKAIPIEGLKAAYGSDFAAEWEKDACAVFNSLPSPVKSEIEEKFFK